MKKLAIMSMNMCLLVLLAMNLSCDIFGPSDPVAITKKDAWTTIINAHAAKQHFYNEFFRIHSNNYKRGQLFVYEPQKGEIDYLWDMFFEVLSYADDVDAAVDTLLTMEIEDGMPLAKLSATSTIFGALADFFRSGVSVNVKNRQRILLIASNMTKMEKDELYNELVIDTWQSEIGTADEFWAKLQNGTLDDKASTLYKNFYDGSNSLLNPFTGYANDKNLSPGKALSKDGLELCNKGLDVVIEAAGTIVPGISKAKDIIDDSKDLLEKTKKMVDKPLDALADEVKSRAIGKISGMVDVDNYFDPDGAGKYVKILAEVSLGTDDPDELVEKGINYGIAKIKSSDKSIKPDYAIAKNTSPTTGIPDFIIGVGNYVQQTQEFIMNLPGGNWDITAKDKSGQTSGTVTTPITSQQESTVDVVVVNSNTTQQDSLDISEIDFSKCTHWRLYLDLGDYVFTIPYYYYTHEVGWSKNTFSLDVFEDSVATNSSSYETSITGNVSLISYDKIGLYAQIEYKSISYGGYNWSTHSYGWKLYMDEITIDLNGIPLKPSSYLTFDESIRLYFEIPDNEDIASYVSFSFTRTDYVTSGENVGNVENVVIQNTFNYSDEHNQPHIEVSLSQYY
ncbi:MAG: hypothetical protein K9N05_06055 [Candidatus Marinimicrobia bacterium]|nr:hypothetical protein [Candidatus Neomarinimicrobiota bacterium]